MAGDLCRGIVTVGLHVIGGSNLLSELFFLDSKTDFRQHPRLVKDNSVGCVSYDRCGKIHALMGEHFDWRDM
ncbi:MAG: hypothetical protein KAW89_09475 [Armatimonadetes bacterium]|nr:hypothetical protein [Armatimonadota bacterium]